jgi:hypothetical protein|tara:strand:+ start:4233 stop:5402 length:1170 start_codon:yes stop_codon:yes gene_type:complete
MDDQLLEDDNLLELSDEEIMAMEVPDSIGSAEAEEALASEADSGDDVDTTPTAKTNEEDTSEELESETEEQGEPVDETPKDVFDTGSTTETDEIDSLKKEESSEDETPNQDSTSDSIDYKKEYDKVMAPFKANGKELSITSADEAIQLMQMGANYSQKMTALKPNLKLLKMLENNSLLDEAKLSYLIDLDKKNPDAIKQLIQDSGLDPLDVDTSDNTDYKPSTYTVNDKEIELDAVLEEIQDTSTYSKTIDLVSNKWDEASRKIVVDNPQIIKLINEHVSNGMYAQIDSTVTKERMLGRLNGLSDIEAYRQIGDQINASGGFSTEAHKPAPQNIPAPTLKKQPDPKMASRKKAAAPTKSAPTKSNLPADFNPLNLSDEDFEKLVSSKFS